MFAFLLRTGDEEDDGDNLFEGIFGEDFTNYPYVSEFI